MIHHREVALEYGDILGRLACRAILCQGRMRNHRAFGDGRASPRGRWILNVHATGLSEATTDLAGRPQAGEQRSLEFGGDSHFSILVRHHGIHQATGRMGHNADLLWAQVRLIQI